MSTRRHPPRGPMGIVEAKPSVGQQHRDQSRMAQLEEVLADCLHYIAVAYRMPSDDDEPECSVKAKKLLGWKLG